MPTKHGNVNRHRLSEHVSRRNFRDTAIEFTYDLLLVYQVVNSGDHTSLRGEDLLGVPRQVVTNGDSR